MKKKCITPAVQFKRGDTFILYCQLTEDDGTPISLQNWDVKSKIRKVNKDLIATLDYVTIDIPNGRFKLRTTSDTSKWPIGQHFCDIEYTTDTDRVMSTQTFIIDVVEDITYED